MFSMLGIVTWASAAATPPSSLDVWWQFLGRLHPVIVHFPIAMLMTAGLVEFLRLFKKKPEPSSLTFNCLIIGTIGAGLASWFGWLNADYEAHGRAVEQTLMFHRWLGIGVAALAAVTLIMAIIDRSGDRPLFRGLHRAGLLLGVPIVGITGHLGGELVFGAGYLTSVFETIEAVPGDEADRGTDGDDTLQSGDLPVVDDGSIVFARDIQPILAERCYDCHGPRRQKGRLRLDDMAAVMEEDLDHFLVTPGDAELSELFIRLTLDPDDPDIMPADGDPLTPEQIDLMRRWIDDGASLGAAAVGVADPSAQQGTSPESPVIEAATIEAITARDPQQRDAAINRLTDRGMLAAVIAESTGAVEVNMALADPVATDDDLALLGGLEDSLAWLRLARTGITDRGMAALPAFPQLRRLYLEHTEITDAGLSHLADLTKIEYLNLYGTAVTDAGLRSLEGLTSLEQLYLWQTQVTDDGVAQLQAALPDLRIVHQEPALVTPVDPPQAIENDDAASGDAAG